MRKKFLAGLLVAAMVASMTACGSDPTANNNSSSDKSSSDSGKKKVGISMPTKSLERWNRDGSYLEEQFKKEGYDVEITYSDNDTDQQVNDIQNMISDNVDILVVAAIDGDTLSTVLADAKDQNIPVISYDRLIMNTDAISYYVSFDNYKVGQLQGQYIIDTLKLDGSKKKYNMEVTAGDPADNNATFFYNGAMDTLKKYIDDGTVKIVSKQQDFESVATQQWSTDEALNRMQNILSSYYADGKNQLDIALCSNDSTALGVTQAIESDYAGKNTPLITGQDGDVANLKNILDGKQAMTVYKAVANEAVVTLKLVKSVLDGNTPDESLTKEFDCECSYDTDSYDNGTGKIPSYLLTPEVITKDNYKEKLVDTGYYKEGADGYLQAVE